MSLNISLTAVGSGYYIVMADGMELSRHTTEREAAERAIIYNCDHPESDVTYHHDYQVRVDYTPPPVPTNLLVTDLTPTSVTLAWS